MLERCLIEFCSSTLASIKAASLFNITFLSKEDAEDQIRFWNIQLKIKGGPAVPPALSGKSCVDIRIPRKTAGVPAEQPGSGGVPSFLRI